MTDKFTFENINPLQILIIFDKETDEKPLTEIFGKRPDIFHFIQFPAESENISPLQLKTISEKSDTADIIFLCSGSLENTLQISKKLFSPGKVFPLFIPLFSLSEFKKSGDNDKIENLLRYANTIIITKDSSLSGKAEIIKCVTSPLVNPGLISPGFNDIRSQLNNGMISLFSHSRGSGPNALITAAEKVISGFPLIKKYYHSALKITVHLSVPQTLGIVAVSEVSDILYGKTNDNCEMLFGFDYRNDKQDIADIYLIASGFNKNILYNYEDTIRCTEEFKIL